MTTPPTTTIIGQVGVVTQNPGWYGRAVQRFTGSPAFHCITAVTETMCVEATTPEVKITPISEFEGVVWLNLPMTPRQRQLAVGAVLQQVNKPYAYGDIAWLALSGKLKGLTPPWLAHYLSSTRQWFCSELADYGYLAAGINAFPGLPDCCVTPADWLRKARETR